MSRPSTRTWLWQLSYALLGFAFLVSLFIAIMGWSTPTFWLCLSIAAASIVLLAVLSRVLNAPRPPSTPIE